MDSSNNNPIEKTFLHDWVEKETHALDVVASWETLCDVYRNLEFNDPINDATKMEEFQWIISEMNKHLTRARSKLLNCPDPETMRDVLLKMFTSTGTKVSNRMNLTYHKLRQMWVGQMINQLDSMIELMKEENNGEPDYWNE